MADHPNIIVIMTDQQRADLSAREGFPLDTTPFLDSLARQGIWFNRAYTSVPVCAPARVSMLTGRFPTAHRVRENYGLDQAVYEQDLFDVMRAHGYATALVGKNHSHVLPERVDFYSEYWHDGIRCEARSPQEKAFDEWLVALHHRVSLEPTPFPLETQLPCRIVGQAQEWIRSLGGRPFCLWLSFPEPHNPYQAPEPYYSLFPPEKLPPVQVGEEALPGKGFKWQYLRQIGEAAHPEYGDSISRARSNYLGMLRLLDDQVRRFVQFLEAEGLRENTLLVFVSDHGDFVGEYGLMRKGAEMPEVLMRVPLLFAGPGIRANAAPHNAHVSLVDLLPTLCEAAGVQSPLGVQGRSLAPLLMGNDYPDEEFASVYAEQGIGGLHYTPDDVAVTRPGLYEGETYRAFDELNACTQSGSMRMVRRGDWKLVLDMQGRGQLYNSPPTRWSSKTCSAMSDTSPSKARC
ncbi:MAG: sulfatase-like hydrolase/transferase [Chloroflexota bacterium]|nr:sulfatase-like hydrolase/transferase [Chloroflexota bacterium]